MAEVSSFVMRELARWQRLPSRYRASLAALQPLVNTGDPVNRATALRVRESVTKLEREWLNAQEITARVYEAMGAMGAGADVPPSVLVDATRLAALMMSHFHAQDQNESTIRAMGGNLGLMAGVPWLWIAVAFVALVLMRGRRLRW